MQNHTSREFERLTKKVVFLPNSSGLALCRLVGEKPYGLAYQIEKYELETLEITDILFESEAFIYDFAVSSNNILAVCHGNLVVVIDIVTKSVFSELSLPYGANSVCFSSNGNHLAAYGLDNFLWHLDLSSKNLNWQQGAPTFEACAPIYFHPNNTSLVVPIVGQGGGWLFLSNLNHNGFLNLQSTGIEHKISLEAGFSYDGNFLYVIEEFLMLYKYPSLELYMAFNGEGEIDFPTVQALENYAATPKISHWSNPVFCPISGNLICKVCSGYICVWNVITGELLEKYPIEDTYSNLLAVSDDGKWLATAGNSKIMEVWKLR